MVCHAIVVITIIGGGVVVVVCCCCLPPLVFHRRLFSSFVVPCFLFALHRGRFCSCCSH
jgi:hypothetical protein